MRTFSILVSVSIPKKGKVIKEFHIHDDIVLELSLNQCTLFDSIDRFRKDLLGLIKKKPSYISISLSYFSPDKLYKNIIFDDLDIDGDKIYIHSSQVDRTLIWDKTLFDQLDELHIKLFDWRQ